MLLPAAVSAPLRGRAEQTTERCVARFSEASEVDGIQGFAIPLPLELMTRLLGLTLEDGAALQPPYEPRESEGVSIRM